MNGVFLRQSVSTPHTTPKKNRLPSDIHLYPYREPIDISLNYSSSSSSSSSGSGSRNGYSPPLPTTDTPVQQRIQRKPVVSNPMVRSCPNEKPLAWKMASPSPAARTNLKKNYAAADTVHPSRIRNNTQIAPVKQPAKSIPSSPAILSNKEKRARTRRHSQGSHLASSNATTAKPFYTSYDDQLKSTTSLATSTAINTTTTTTTTATATTTTSSVTKSNTFWHPRSERPSEPLKPLKRGLSKKIRGLLQPHRMQIEQGASNEQHTIDCQESLKRCQTPVLDDDENPFRILRLVIFCYDAISSNITS
ncbi:hypothetical protein BD408DRAFT_68494 [Parasitella parasitica]|nr:hypothetical protein BD408DRAFT_68494 [Parasitella parasitica]